MTEPEAPKPTADALEFEITDFAVAREALNQPPSGVGRAATFAPGYWEQKRRKLLPRDRALAGPTIDWLLSLAPTLRPRLLCEHYPRIANQIAELWPYPEERVRFLDALLTDARGGRRGFAFELRREIETLRRM